MFFLVSQYLLKFEPSKVIGCRLVIISSFCLLNFPLQAKVINVAAIDWCPQICIEKENPGYLIDIIDKIYDETDYQLVIDFYPWSRAIKLVREGKVHAILAPAKSEAPDLLYPVNEVGTQTMCFFTNISSDWEYQNTESLQGMQIGIAQDTGLEELTNYRKQNPEQFQVQPYVERFVKQNAGKLQNNRIDSFLFTLNATLHALNRLGINAQFRNAGCVSQSKIYFAFYNGKKNNEVKEMMRVFDKKIVRMHKDGSVNNIMKKYQLENWKTLSENKF